MLLEQNLLESSRFGVVVTRLVDPDAPVDAINAAALGMGAQMVTARIDTRNLRRVQVLEADGYRLMDTLVYYRHALGSVPAWAGVPAVSTVRRATPEDAPAVAEVARMAFARYGGHYHADPRLDDAASDAAYVEWAERSIAAADSRDPAFVVLHERQIRGFLTLRFNSPEEAEIVLNAVHPEFQRRGLYGALLRCALREAELPGRRSVIVSTQLINIAMQRVWVRHAFVPDRSLYTLHKWFG